MVIYKKLDFFIIVFVRNVISGMKILLRRLAGKMKLINKKENDRLLIYILYFKL